MEANRNLKKNDEFAFLTLCKESLKSFKNKKVLSIFIFIFFLLSFSFFSTASYFATKDNLHIQLINAYNDKQSIVRIESRCNATFTGFSTNIKNVFQTNVDQIYLPLDKNRIDNLKEVTQVFPLFNNTLEDFSIDKYYGGSLSPKVTTETSSPLIEKPYILQGLVNLEKNTDYKDLSLVPFNTSSILPSNSDEIAISTYMAHTFYIFGYIDYDTNINAEPQYFDKIDEILGKKFLGKQIVGIFSSKDLDINLISGNNQNPIELNSYLENSSLSNYAFLCDKNYEDLDVYYFLYKLTGDINKDLICLKQFFYSYSTYDSYGEHSGIYRVYNRSIEIDYKNSNNLYKIHYLEFSWLIGGLIGISLVFSIIGSILIYCKLTKSKFSLKGNKIIEGREETKRYYIFKTYLSDMFVNTLFPLVLSTLLTTAIFITINALFGMTLCIFNWQPLVYTLLYYFIVVVVYSLFSLLSYSYKLKKNNVKLTQN